MWITVSEVKYWSSLSSNSIESIPFHSIWLLQGVWHHNYYSHDFMFIPSDCFDLSCFCAFSRRNGNFFKCFFFLFRKWTHWNRVNDFEKNGIFLPFKDICFMLMQSCWTIFHGARCIFIIEPCHMVSVEVFLAHFSQFKAYTTCLLCRIFRADLVIWATFRYQALHDYPVDCVQSVLHPLKTWHLKLF